MIGRPLPVHPQPNKSQRLNRLFAVCLLLFVLISTFNVYDNFKRISLMKHQVSELESKIQQLKLENLRLASVLKQMDSGEYIERIAREELGLVRKGEILVITVGDQKK